MRLFITGLLLIIMACAPARSWNLNIHEDVSFIYNSHHREILETAVVDELTRLFERWGIRFNYNAATGSLDFWRGNDPLNPDNTTIGRAPFNSRCICKPRHGVFITDNLWNEIKHLSTIRVGKILARIAAHEIGHAYNLRHPDEISVLFIMSSEIPYNNDNLTWSRDSIEKLDKKLGIK